MKQILPVFIVLFAASAKVSAYDFEYNGIYFNVLSVKDKTVEVTWSQDKYTGDVTVEDKAVFEGTTYTVTGVGKGAFHNCPGLISVKLPQTVSKIGESAFSVSHDLQSVELPPSVTEIGQFAFHYSDNLKSAVVPDCLTKLLPCTFAFCTNLENVTLPPGITSIGLECFQECESLIDIALPDSLRLIGEYAFEWCKKLKAVIVPEQVYLIERMAFIGCESLETLEIKSNTSIGEEAFKNCNALTTIRSYTKTPLDFPDNAIPGIVKLHATLYVPAGAKAAYEASSSWGQFQNIVEMESSGIRATRSDKTDGKAYRLNGTPATESDKGIIIHDGKKTVQK